MDVETVRWAVFAACMLASVMVGWRFGHVLEERGWRAYPWHLVLVIVAVDMYLGWVIQ